MKQESERFNDTDRRLVIDLVQKHYFVKLHKVERRRKWLRDESGRNWAVIGGIGTFHGMPEEIVEHERRSETEGLLVIAYMKRTEIEVFVGPLGSLVSASGDLSRSNHQLLFEVVVSGDCMRCKKAPNVVLKRLDTIPYSTEDREREKNVHAVLKSVSHMSREERTALMDKLNHDYPGPGE